MRLPNVPRIPVVHGLKLFVSARLSAHWDWGASSGETEIIPSI